MYLDGDGAAAELAYWKAEAERRRERDRRYGEALHRNALGYDVTVGLKEPPNVGKGMKLMKLGAQVFASAANVGRHCANGSGYGLRRRIIVVANGFLAPGWVSPRCGVPDHPLRDLGIAPCSRWVRGHLFKGPSIADKGDKRSKGQVSSHPRINKRGGLLSTKTNGIA